MKLIIKSLMAAALISVSASAAVLATVNGKTITSEEVNAVLMEGTQGRFTSLPKEKQDELQQRVVEGLVMQELVYEEAKKEGVLESAKYKKEYDDIVARIEKQLAAKVWQENLLDGIQVSDKEIKAYYDGHGDEFEQKEKVHARHILVKTEDEAKKIISGMKSLKGDKLKEKFIEDAKAKSTGPSGPKGGDLGFFQQGQMVPEFNDAVFSMKVGTITPEPVKTQFGYHVIYLEEKQAGKKATLDEAKPFIEQRLKQEKFQKEMEAKTKALKNAAKITYSK
ncbi:peptidyl-prolyl cis-trans isomerase [Sulfurimonas sp. HSL-3221]|uniref:peptidylprolyl isomerase n=1 Tax=Sulfurimonadaceae TaxID=2771471 RepID=UPI001E4C28FF|nr:peptidyl-prolyl cis-trans isomerase [Sulfurimonas sp. HSL-3221]UFS61486.1 peptidyl-prolyl cis-trans isomerase [Sulfurimonas sp. HSL-3221]